MNYWIVPSIKTEFSGNIDRVERAVCYVYKLTPESLHEKTRKREIKNARQMVQYILRTYYNIQLIRISAFYNQDHSTVINSCNQVKNYLDTEEETREKLSAILIELDLKLKSIKTA